MVREALEESVTWMAPPVIFQISQVSIVPKARSPFSAILLAFGT